MNSSFSYLTSCFLYSTFCRVIPSPFFLSCDQISELLHHSKNQNMGCIKKINCRNSQTRRCNNIITVSFFFTFAFLISPTLFTQGRKISADTVTTNDQERMTVRLRSMIGSRPPRCGEIIRCGSCGRCEPVQVPILPLKRFQESSMAFFRGGAATNYKPMCWKCKCGDSIFDP